MPASRPLANEETRAAIFLPSPKKAMRSRPDIAAGVTVPEAAARLKFGIAGLYETMENA